MPATVLLLLPSPFQPHSHTSQCATYQYKFLQRKKPIHKRVHLLFEGDGVLLIDDQKKTELLNSYFAFVLTVKGKDIQTKMSRINIGYLGNEAQNERRACRGTSIGCK